jgi:hypothetical protein
MYESGITKQLLHSLELFSAQIEMKHNLEIVCEVEGGGCEGSDIIVIENSNIAKDIEGHQITVEVPEIFAKCTNEHEAERFIAVINLEKPAIACEGVTRIVGYYSRVQNWNKSKVGELRDRQKGQYGTGQHVKQYEREALATVDAL